MDEDSNLDLSALRFDELVEFFFQRPENEEYWYHDPANRGGSSTASAPQILIDHLTRLFSEFAVVAARFSLTQIDHGLWALSSVGFSLTAHLWDASIPLEKRVRCVRSMRHMYSDFVAISDVEVMVGCFGMWWDEVATDFWSHVGQLQDDPDVSKLDSESRSVLDAMFVTLQEILDLPDLRTKGYALHGLGHLHHPGVRPLIQKHIDQNKDQFSEEGLRWVERCRDGTVM